MGKALITGDYIYDEILVQDQSKVNKSVVTINNNDIEQYFRNSGVNIIYEFMEAMNSNESRQIEIDYLPFYESEKIPKFVTISKWKIKKDKDKDKYYIDEFLGSMHDFYDKEKDTYEMYKSSIRDDSAKYNVFSIYDRFSSMLVKGEPLEDYAEVARNKKIKDFLEASDNIILRTKYFKNNDPLIISSEYMNVLNNSPFNIISQDENLKLYDKTILLISLREIRDLETYIPVGTSWEELIKNINNIFSLRDYSDLNKIRYVIITLDDDGVIISYKDEDPNKRKYALICNPETIDGYRKNHTVDYNKVSGYLSIMQGYLTYKIAQKDPPDNIGINDIMDICLEGYVGACHLDELGFREGSTPSTLYIDNKEIISYITKYKSNGISAEKSPKMNIYKLDLDNDTPNFHFLDYSIQKEAEQNLAYQFGVAIVWAKYIVKYGYKKFYEKLNRLNIFIPYAKFEDLISFDKIEIEQLRDIEKSIIDYKRNTDLQSPLSIAVFGEPGSGKSYTIDEIAKNIFKTEKPTVLTFNISQFKNADELIESFRLIQNAVLRDTIPIVFWDEFDSMYEEEELGWLKYFLAPMQSGKFVYNQVEYKIGRCIFIFAGGTCATHKEFVIKCKETGMKKVKAPDFLGRLRATLDIPSLSRPKDRIINDVEERLYKDSLDLYGTFIKKQLDNLIKENIDLIDQNQLIKKYAEYELLRHKSPDKDIYGRLIEESDHILINDNIIKKTSCVVEQNITNKHSNFSYIFRRAIILRKNLLKILNRDKDAELKIQDPVLNAFLMVDKYYYDSRSMIAILDLFHIQYKEFTIRISGIPSAQQLSLHTNEKEFIKYCKYNYLDSNSVPDFETRDNTIPAINIIDAMNNYQNTFYT